MDFLIEERDISYLLQEDNNEELQEEMLNKYITDTDVCNLEWRILNYICKMSEKYASFPETELLDKTGSDTKSN